MAIHAEDVAAHLRPGRPASSLGGSLSRVQNDADGRHARDRANVVRGDRYRGSGVGHGFHQRENIQRVPQVEVRGGLVQQQDRGSLAMQRAIATRWRSPPDRRSTVRARRCVSPDCVMAR